MSVKCSCLENGANLGTVFQKGREKRDQEDESRHSVKHGDASRHSWHSGNDRTTISEEPSRRTQNTAAPGSMCEEQIILKACLKMLHGI